MPPLRLLALVAQLAALVWIATLFEIESASFRNLLALGAGGFLVHALLPSAARLLFNIGLSVGGVALVLGVQAAGWVVALGAGLIAICHLPMSFAARVAALGAAGVAILAAWRAGVDYVPTAVWPLLGSMFVFRIVLYMYSVRHDLGRHGWKNSLAYFFLFPNVCFPLFPVVDYNTFERTYMRRPLSDIAQDGVRWIAHGFVHLMLYRVVYHELSTRSVDVASGPEALWFVTTNALLYLRVSGQFHIIVGMLQLFGFDLPRTHRHYLLAENFSDFWRRVNIYWKDFMVKVFYYPTFFRLKARGRQLAMAASVVVVFVASWFLHSYQTLWLLGVWDLRWQDSVFWAVLGALVLYNSLRPAPRRDGAGVGAFTRRALRVFGTFWCIAFMWSLWSSQSLALWAGMWVRAVANPLGSWSLPAAGLALVVQLIVLGVAADWSAEGPLRRWIRARTGTEQGTAPPWRLVAARSSAIVALMAFLGASPWAAAQIPASWNGAIHNPGLNERDQALVANGYYERIITGARTSPELFAAMAATGERLGGFYATAAGLMRDDFAHRHLAPSARVTFRDTVVATNSHGMRDDEYTVAKPPDTVRVALLGASMSMGWGVEHDEGFESRLEARLRADRTHGNVEILNFAVPGYSALEQPWVYEHKVRAFDPDLVLLMVATIGSRPSERLAEKLLLDIEIPYDDLAEMGRSAMTGAPRDIDRDELAQRLDPRRLRLSRWSYAKLAEFTEADAIQAVGVLMPRLNERERRDAEMNRHVGWLQEAGFGIVDLRTAFGDRSPSEIHLSELDRHPSPAAHAVIAEALYAALRSDSAIRAILWP